MTTITVQGDLYEMNFFEIGMEEFLILTGRITEDEEVDLDDDDLRTHQLTLPGTSAAMERPWRYVYIAFPNQVGR